MAYKDPQKAKEYGRLYWIRNREKWLEKNRNWKKNNPDKVKAEYERNKVKYIAYARKSTQRKRELALEKLGNKCIKCGFSDKRALQIDHINGEGKFENSNRYKIYNNVINGSKKYQLLCANCNWIKKYEKGEWANYLKKRNGNN